MTLRHYDVFLSYSSQDSKLAERVYRCIQGTKLNCFLAKKEIEAGQKWEATIEEALKSSAQAVFLITQNTKNSDWVRVELGMARALRKEIVPVLDGLDTEAAGVLSLFRDFGLQYARIDSQQSESSIEEVARQLASRNEFVGFWQAFLADRTPGQGIHIVMSAKPPREMSFGHTDDRRRGHTILVSLNEVQAFVQLKRALVELSDDLEGKIELHHGGLDLREVRAIPSPDDIRPLRAKQRASDGETVVIDSAGQQQLRVPEFPLNENLIIIGSVHANLICETVLHSLEEQDRGLPFRFDSVRGRKSISWGEGESFPPHGSDQNEETDYGVLVRICNPFCSRNRALILAGNHGFGTQAAVQFVSDRRYIRQLQEKADRRLDVTDDVAVLFEARVRSDQGLAKELNILKIARYDGNDGWRIVYA